MWRKELSAFAAATVILATASIATAEVGSDKAAAIVLFPKLIVNLDTGVDTLVRLSNTSESDEQNVYCFYVNVTPLCSRSQFSCYPDPDECELEGGTCSPQWNETDFLIRLTSRQPTSWLVSRGLDTCRPGLDRGACSNNPGVICEVDEDCLGGRCVMPSCLPLTGEREGPRDQQNIGKIPPSPQEPFIGELKCIAVSDENGTPESKNTLQGEALIGQVIAGGTLLDLSGYNAIGIPSTARQNNRDHTLVIGGPTAEYEGCPYVLILNHFFDGAIDPITALPGGPVRVGTDLTLVPCTQDFNTQNPGAALTTAQFLVFNEFEQRFSTSTPVNCFKEIRLSNLDSTQNERSIFSAGVAGTLTGQTRIRGVADGSLTHGNALLAISEEYRCAGPGFPLCSRVNPAGLISSNAGNVHFQGQRSQSDYIYLPEQ